MTQSAPGDVIRGTVQSVNAKGVKLNGEWFNFSKFRQVAPPEPGQVVELAVRSGFINGLKLVDDRPPAAPPQAQQIQAAAPRPAPGTARAGDGPAPVSRDQEIRRLALLKAAAAFHAGRPEATPDDVLSTAILWEVWVHDPA